MIFAMNNVNNRNISAIEQRISELEERRIIELYEFSLELSDYLFSLKDELNVQDMLTLFSEIYGSSNNVIHDNHLPVNKEKIDKFLKSVSEYDAMFICEMVIQNLRNLGLKISDADFLEENLPSEIIAYHKTALSDEAYDIFSESFNDPRVKYSNSLREAASFVSDGLAGYALLPFEESGGERIHATSEIIFKNDYKINSVTPVFGLDGAADMKYALVSKSFTVPKVYEDDDLYFEIRLSSSTSLDKLLRAATYFDASVYRINTISFKTGSDNENYYSLVLKSNVGNFTYFIAYLIMFSNSYTPVGIYKNLE